MATYKQLIKTSLRQIQAIPKGGFEPDSGELADAFEMLGILFDEVSSERWGVNAIIFDSLTLTANDNEYTVGATGDLVTARPKKIRTAYIRQDNSDYSIEVISRERYATIVDKTTTGRPYYLYYEETYPNGTLKLYPMPDSAYDLRIESWKELTKPTDVTDTVNLPSEFVPYFTDKLSVYMAPEYGTEASQTIQMRMLKSERRLKNIHSSNIPRAHTDPFNSDYDYEIDGDTWT
jgi:hypothetical protein